MNKTYLSGSLTAVLILTLVASFIPMNVMATVNNDHKIFICHQNGQSGNYNVLWVDQNGWNGHDDHSGDFIYEGGFPLNKNWCKDNAPQDPPSEEVTVVAQKVVCDHEEDLPNWGNGSFGPITESTAQDWVDQSNGHCELVDWDFQWASNDATNPGDNLGVAGDPWTTFSGSTLIEVNDLNRIWVREVWNDNYIPFTGVNTDQDESAEIYCETDVLHYDNYDFIDNPQAGETYYCVGFNVPVREPAACIPGEELIVNGSFEEPEVEHEAQWDVFTAVLGWNIDWVNSTEEAEPSLELHRGVAGWLSYDGEQHAELDGDWFGPANSGQGASTKIFQDIATVPGRDYELKFAFSPRPNTSAGDNVLGVTWDGAEVGASPFSVANATNQTIWTEYTHTLTASDDLTRILFEDRSTENSLGTFLDNVSLKCLPECEDTNGLISSGENTVVINEVLDLNDPDTTDIPAVAVSPVADIQALGADVWDATTSDGSAVWVWSENPVADWEVDKWVTFQHTFTVDGDATLGTLEIGADNSYEVWVNGVVTDPADFSDESENNHSIADSYDVTSLLIDGENTLTIRVKNWALPGAPLTNNPGGLLYTLSWEAQDCSPDDNGGGGEPEPEIPTLELSKDGTYNAETGKISFDIHYEVNGEGTAQNVVITDPIPSDTTYVTDSATNGGVEAGGVVTWGLGDLAAGAEGNVVFEVMVDDIGSMWADSVVSENQGLRKDNSAVLPDRSDSSDALGAPESTGTAYDNPVIAGSFYSLGFGGEIVLGFETEFINGSGDDIKIFEVTGGSSYPDEKIMVEASQNGVDWSDLGTVIRDGGVDLGGLTWAKYVRLTDVSNSALFSNDADGYDLDAVKVMYPQPDVCDVYNEVSIDADNADSENADTAVPVNEGACLPPPPVCDNGYVLDNDQCLPPTDDPVDVCPKGYHDEDGQCVLDDQQPNPDPVYACSDSLDNDQDDQTDYPNDSGCDSPTDDDETNSPVGPQAQGGQGGNGGTGGSGGGGSRVISRTGFPTIGTVLGAATGLDGIPDSCPIYLNEFIKLGGRNNPSEVSKLQTFLNEYLNANLPITGFYGPLTFAAVKQFQLLYSGNVLKPWVEVGLHDNENIPTGYVYKTTRRWINLMKCPELNIPLPDLSQG